MIDLTNVDVVFEGPANKQGRRAIHAVDSVDLHVEAGDVYGIVGYSGAGKSTLVRVINLLQRPTSGTVLVDGLEMTALADAALRKARRKIGMIFQQFNLLNSRTVAGNVAYPLKNSGLDAVQIKAKVNSLLELVGMADRQDAYPSQLSGGMKQRVAIARAVANDPDVLLCDEATSALDPKNTGAILELLKRLNTETGLTIVLITHEMSVVKDICNKVAVMQDGRIVERGATIDIFTHPQARLTKDFVDVASRVQQGIETAISHPDLLHLQGNDRLVELSFTGGATGDPLISTLARDYGVSANVLFANVEIVQGTPVGNLLLVLTGEEHNLQLAVTLITDSGVDLHTFTTEEVAAIKAKAGQASLGDDEPEETPSDEAFKAGEKAIKRGEVLS